jgi:hypothetical protein
MPRLCGEFFDGVPVKVPGGEIDRCEPAFFPQDLIDDGNVLKELRPVQRGHQAHARDDVARRRVHGGLFLVLHAYAVVGDSALGFQPLVQPPQHGRDAFILIAKAQH